VSTTVEHREEHRRRTKRHTAHWKHLQPTFAFTSYQQAQACLDRRRNIPYQHTAVVAASQDPSAKHSLPFAVLPSHRSPPSTPHSMQTRPEPHNPALTQQKLFPAHNKRERAGGWRPARRGEENSRAPAAGRRVVREMEGNASSLFFRTSLTGLSDDPGG
jgi:hypothetical protein